MGRSYTQIAIDDTKSSLEKLKAELAASIAEMEAKQAAETRTARIESLVSTAGIGAADIHISRLVPNRKLTRNELLISAAQQDLDSLAADIQSAIESGTPIPTAEPVAEPVPAPVRLAGWAGIRQAAKAGRAYSKAYTDTYEREMARSRR